MGFTRRALSFNTLSEVAAEADSLLDRGYSKGGNWDLSQVALHLRDWLRYPVHGYPRTPFLIRPVIWTLRVTVGKSTLRKILTTGRMPQGGPTMSQTVHDAGGDERAAVGELKVALKEWEQHSGPYLPSPIFGAWDRDQATKLQLVHCAHHLGFLIPNG